MAAILSRPQCVNDVDKTGRYQNYNTTQRKPYA